MGQNTGLQQETTQIILFPSSGRKILQLPEKFTFTLLTLNVLLSPVIFAVLSVGIKML